MYTCKNCGNSFEGNFCNQCGQSQKTQRLSFHFLWHDLQHGLFHFDKGLIYSARQLVTRPGHSIREFIEGKRVKHFMPFSMLILLGTLYGFLYHSFHINTLPTDSPHNNSEVLIDYKALNEWISKHYAWTTLITLPFYTLGTWIAFRKQGYNLAEYFVLNTFKGSQRLFVHLAAFPFLFWANGTSKMPVLINVLYLIDLFLIFWTNIQFFNRMHWIRALLLSILSHIIFFVAFFIMMVILLLIIQASER